MENTEKRALVTGASEGIGRALCLALAKEGYTVTGVARNKPRLESLVKELQSISDSKHDFQVYDLSNMPDVSMLAALLATRKYDVFVNNAGVGLYGDFVTVESHKIFEMIQLNCLSLVALSQQYLKQARSGDALINVASVAAFLPLPRNAVYAATKAFVQNLTVSLWLLGKKRGVYVCSICPGYTETQFAVRAGGDPKKNPRGFATTSEKVANSVIKVLKRKRRPFVVPDLMNSLIVFTTRLLPTSWIVRIADRMTRKAFGE